MPKGLRTLRFSFDENNLTHYGGMVLTQPFCKLVRAERRDALAVPKDYHCESEFLSVATAAENSRQP